ncbi:Very-long-chain enoyl-CoA reductase [Lamellibrachia satsuma]|nr:Very-long-chain enoyl-CoA reductase [Lamellibrachia satsuma]
MAMEVEIVHTRSSKSLGKLTQLSKNSTILDVKKQYLAIKPKLYAERQAFRTEPRGKILKDEDTLEQVGISNGDKLYFKDLGPQVSWTTVFLVEYAGPLVIYLLFYLRPSIIYGAGASSHVRQDVINIACCCWTFHYAKRLLETIFIHRFSHATMPVRNIVKVIHSSIGHKRAFSQAFQW